MTTDVQTVLAGLRARPSSIDHLVWLLTGASVELETQTHAIEAASQVDVGHTNLGDLLTWVLGGFEVLLEMGFGRSQARKLLCGLAWALVGLARPEVQDARTWARREGRRWGLIRDRIESVEPGGRSFIMETSCQFEMGEVESAHGLDVSGDLCCLIHEELPTQHWSPTWELCTFEDIGELRAALAKGNLVGVRLDPERREEWLSYLGSFELELLATGVIWKRYARRVTPEYAMRMGPHLCLELCGLTLAEEPDWLDLQHDVPPEFVAVSLECVHAFGAYALARHFERDVREMRTLFDEALLVELEQALARPHPEDAQMPARWPDWGGFDGGERDWAHAASALVLIRWEDARRSGARMLSTAWFGRQDDTDIFLREEAWLVIRALRVMEVRLGEDFGVSTTRSVT